MVRRRKEVVQNGTKEISTSRHSWIINLKPRTDQVYVLPTTAFQNEQKLLK